MFQSGVRNALSFVAAFALLVSPLESAFAQDTLGGADAATEAPTPAPANPAPGRFGPGAPPTAPRAPEVKKAAPKQPAASAAKGIHLAPITPIAKTVNVHDKVLEQCAIQTLLPQSIAQRSANVVLADGSGAMKLELIIVDIHAPNGGVFSGPKWVTVEGRLLQGKTVKGTFTAKESSMGSTSSCGMLSKVIRVMADDIVIWLNNPAKGSKLGRAR